MKLIQILKVAAIPVLTVFSFLSTSNTALAEYSTSQGSGGEYRYELWSSDDNKDYYLKIWSNQASPESTSYSTTPHFSSTSEALIYFDCHYGGQNLPDCPQSDYLMSRGAGGEYRYELWSGNNNNNYYLKIWPNQASPESTSYSIARHFPSSNEALIYFNCRYGGQNLPECHRR